MQAEPLVAALQKDHKVETGRLVSVSATPEKARRQADLATADLAAAQQLLAAAATKHMEVDAAVRGVNEHLRQRQASFFCNCLLCSMCGGPLLASVAADFGWLSCFYSLHVQSCTTMVAWLACSQKQLWLELCRALL